MRGVIGRYADRDFVADHDANAKPFHFAAELGVDVHAIFEIITVNAAVQFTVSRRKVTYSSAFADKFQHSLRRSVDSSTDSSGCEGS